MGGREPKDAKEPDEDRLRIGTKRMLAITHVLTHCTDASYNLLQMNLVWVGDYSLSAINDATLGLARLWKGPLLDADSLPDDVALLARDAAARAEVNPREVTIKPMKCDELLTAKQHDMIMQKALHCFEDEALHLSDRHTWKSLIPNTEQWRTYRNIIQNWDHTISSCCKAILFGDAMDSQIITIIKRFPKFFHVGMIPDLMTTFANNTVDQATQAQIEADHAKWQGSSACSRSTS